MAQEHSLFSPRLCFVFIRLKVRKKSKEREMAQQSRINSHDADKDVGKRNLFFLLGVKEYKLV